MAEDHSERTPMSGATRMQLHQIRRALLLLHKAILEMERNAYERVHGRVAASELLQLVMHDPWFGWFRPISEIVVQLDDMLDSDDPVAQEDAEALLREIRSLIQPSEEGEEFAVKYYQTLQQDPATILAHAEVSRLLQPRKRNK